MTNLMTASNQWASRPDDQRFLDLESLGDAVDRRRMASRQVTLPLNKLDVNYTDDNELVVDGHGGAHATLTNWSFGQLATIAKAPAAYLRKLPAPMAMMNLQYGLENSDDARQNAKLLYRESGEVGEIRAATSPQYGRIWDSQIVSAVQKMNADGRWTVPLKAYDGVNSKQATTLYASDRDVFIFLVDESRPIDIDEQTYFRGFYTWNSEVGKATFGLATFLYSYVCANRIIWGARDIEELRIRHTSMAPERFIEQATPALAALSESSAEPIVAAIRKAKDTYVGKTMGDVESFLARKGFKPLESKVAISLAASGGSSGSSGNPANLWDLIQGGTAAAREIGSQDDRLGVEKRWSSLLGGIDN
jgi:hypothetical protein